MDTGVPASALERYIEEQIFSLPGTDEPREQFSVLLTGSRAVGGHSPSSDVDIDVVCRRAIYESVQRAALAAGRIKSIGASLYVLREDDWQKYFGEQAGRPHFSLIPIEEVERQFQEYDDVSIWIWTNAEIIHDPNGQFRTILESFSGYPHDVLVGKIKYRWMLAAYWAIDVYPHHHSRDDELLPAAMGILNGVNELYRFFFLVEGKPFPYTEKLPRFVSSTKLGRSFAPFLARVVDFVLGRERQDRHAWARLDEASRLLCDSDTSPECRRLEEAAAQAMRAAGVEKEWLEADYENMTELLSGKLGPVP